MRYQNFVPLLFIAMATSSNKMDRPPPDFALLQGHLHIDDVDFDLVNQYLIQRFTYPPTGYINLQGTVVEQSLPMREVCPNLLASRPCPSFFDPEYDCTGVHPEFFYRNGYPGPGAVTPSSGNRPDTWGHPRAPQTMVHSLAQRCRSQWPHTYGHYIPFRHLVHCL